MGITTGGVTTILIAAMATLLLGAPSVRAAEDAPLPIVDGTWREIAEAPFGSAGAGAAWTGDRMIVVDFSPADTASRAAAHDPATDTWTELPSAPTRLDANSPSAWTGEELLVFDYDTRKGFAFDPVQQTWRRLAPTPIRGPRLAVWADGQVVVGNNKRFVAAYDPQTDVWTELPRAPGAQKRRGLLQLVWTGSKVLAMTMGSVHGFGSVAALDLESRTWGERTKSPLCSMCVAAGLWAERDLVVASGDPNADGSIENAAFDPVAGTWSVREYDCLASTGSGLWTGRLVLDPFGGWARDPQPGHALDPATGECYELADSRIRRQFLFEDGRGGPAASVWTGDELILWSGVDTDLMGPVDARGISFTVSETMPRRAEATPSATPIDWGPLAVVSEGGAPDAGLGPGTLSIGADCVTLKGNRAEEGVTLVWPSDETSWRPNERQIVFEYRTNGITRLSDGDRVKFGGMSLEQDTPEVTERISAWLEESWIQPPHPSCPTEHRWHVGEVRVLDDDQ